MPSDGVSGDTFGFGLAIGNGLVLVGAPQQGFFSVSTGPGAVYAFRFDPDLDTWEEWQKITASDGDAGDTSGGMTGDYFSQVALHGDRLLVGAYRDDNATGSAYLFRRYAVTDTWEEILKFRAADAPSRGGVFGWQVAFDGTTAVIGAPRYDDHGAVYVFGELNSDCDDPNDPVPTDDDSCRRPHPQDLRPIRHTRRGR